MQVQLLCRALAEEKAAILSRGGSPGARELSAMSDTGAFVKPTSTQQYARGRVEKIYFLMAQSHYHYFILHS